MESQVYCVSYFDNQMYSNRLFPNINQTHIQKQNDTNNDLHSK